MNFITEHRIETYADLESKVAEIRTANDEAAAALKDVESRLADMAVLMKNISTYKQTRPVALEYRRAKDKDNSGADMKASLFCMRRQCGR